MKLRHPLFILSVSVALSGCQVIEQIQNLEDMANGEVSAADVIAGEVAQALNVGVAGLSPSPNYAQNGNVDLSLISRGTELSPAEIAVEVKNHDGSYSSCEHGEGIVVDAAPLNALSLLIDGSGSMERTYPDGECDTCPHDPGRERVGAAHRFIDTLYDVGPDSRLAIAEFGPSPSAGFGATALHADFDDDRRRLWTALDSIGGHEPLGTPLYDSTYEMIEATADYADVLSLDYREAIPRHVVILSDGIDNASERHDLHDTIAAALAHNVVVYVVGLGPASASDTRFDDVNLGIRELQTLADATGGFYAGVADPNGLHQLFDNVAYALAGGYERHTYNCIPRDSATSTVIRPPASGTRVEGRLLEITSGETRSSWAFIAP